MVFPAHAGMSRRDFLFQLRRVRFPRPRGDEPAFQEANGGLEMFSPPTRG